jgi:ornithine cyclodeaminase
MRLRILSAADVGAALPMPAAIDAMRAAFGQLSAGQAAMPLRARLDTEKGLTLFMPAYLRGSRALAVKVVSVYGDNAVRGLPSVAGCVLALDPETGLPLALMEGARLTAIRTGAGGGLAAQLLARPDSRVVALFGAGVQARTQLEAVMAVRPVQVVNIVSRTRESAQRLADETAQWPNAPLIHTELSAQQAVREADIVIAATTSSTPVFDGRDLKPGAHVTGVGSFTPQMQEVDAVTVQRARIVVDSRTACAEEAGDLIIPNATVDAELGEIVNGVKSGRETPEEITFFKSVGVAVQDAAAAAAVLREAEARNLGTMVEL